MRYWKADSSNKIVHILREASLDFSVCGLIVRMRRGITFERAFPSGLLICLACKKKSRDKK